MNESTTTPDYSAIKTKQRATWASGDYAVVGTTLQIVGETLCEAVDLRAGERVIDVAAGNGNASLAAARRYARVTATDYVPALLERAAERARAERLPLEIQEADAEALPFGEASFDVALSTFGVMFTPDQRRAAAELVRVVRPGGRIALASWTPDSVIGQLFATIGKFVPPPAGVMSPARWGSAEVLGELFAGHDVVASTKHFTFRYHSPEHWLEVFETYYGPTHKALGALDEMKRAALRTEMLALVGRHNLGGDRSLVVPGAYLEAVITRR